MTAKFWIFFGVLALILFGILAWLPHRALTPINPPENSATSTVSAGTRQVFVYFSNNKLDPKVTCEKVFPVIRSVNDTPEIAREAIAELLKGPTSQEKTIGYSTSIADGVSLRSLVINDGQASVDFSSEIINPGGSCRATAIRAQITQTLQQFSGINNVIITSNGRLDILEP